jgi:transcription elongation GreA/GreB family factor
MPSNSSIKLQLYEHCRRYVRQRLDTITLALEDARQAAGEETKSSVGDKYETTRAMMQLEQEKLASQLAEAQRLQTVLDRIQPQKESATVVEGSLVHTGQGSYFVAISAGKVEIAGRSYFHISLASPMGEALVGRRAGEVAEFRGQGIAVLEVL